MASTSTYEAAPRGSIPPGLAPTKQVLISWDHFPYPLFSRYPPHFSQAAQRSSPLLAVARLRLRDYPLTCLLSGIDGLWRLAGQLYEMCVNVHELVCGSVCFETTAETDTIHKPTQRKKGHVSTMDFASLSLEALGAEARARIDAGDKAQQQAEDRYLSAGLHLIEAKRRINDDSGTTDKAAAWVNFLRTHCNIGKTRAWELMAIADGRTTIKELNERKNANRASVVVWNSVVEMCDSTEPVRVRESTKRPKPSTERSRLEAQVISDIRKLSLEGLKTLAEHLRPTTKAAA